MTQVSRLHVVLGEFAVETPAKTAPAKAAPERKPAKPEPLWREVLGEQLRELRQRHRETLAETAARAGISPQYLSEVERGLKEPSSEMIAAVAGALGTTLGGLAEAVADELREQREASAVLERAMVSHAVVTRTAMTRTATTRGHGTSQVLLALAA